MVGLPTPRKNPARPGLAEPLLTFLVGNRRRLGPLLAGPVRAVRAGQPARGHRLIFLWPPGWRRGAAAAEFDYDGAGLRLRPIRLNLAVLLVALAITWPVFLAAFLAFYGVACSVAPASALGYLMDWMAPTCARWVGWRGAGLRLPPDLLVSTLTQIVVVALPEELFFRGYLQGRLDERWPPLIAWWREHRSAWVSSCRAALFALGHVLVDFDLQRLAVFAPGLVFGWMRARTGSLAPGAVFHALVQRLLRGPPPELSFDLY